MWMSCLSVGAVTRLGLSYSATDPAAFIRSEETAATGGTGEAVLADRYRVPPFEVKEILGRRGSSTLDRNGALALMAAKECLESVEVDPSRTGVVVGTTVGSFSSTSNFSALTMTEDKPYNVPPSLFPNTVMNSAAGLTAIRHGLTGPNTTIAGGEFAGLTSLQYLSTLFAAGYLDAALLICVEEDSPHRRIFHELRGAPDCGEAAVAMLLVPGDVPNRRFRLYFSDSGDDEAEADSSAPTVRASAGIASLDGGDVDIRQIFGTVGAATFGCQVLTAMALLDSGAPAVVVAAPGVAGRGAENCVVAA